jgi:anti-repressor protein
MNEIQIFKNEQFGEIRTIVIEGVVWFIGKDVTLALGYENASKALKDHVDEEDKLNNESLSSLGQRGGWLINESGIYTLVLSSKLPAAKKFRRWVTSDILPSIYKHGLYATDETIEIMLNDPDTMIKTLQAYKEERQKRIAAETENAVLKPKAEYADHMTEAKNTIMIGELAKVLAKDGAEIGQNRLFNYLRNIKVLTKSNLPYQRYVDAGYFKVVEKVTGMGFSYFTTKVTAKGQLYIFNRLKKDQMMC